MSRREAGTSGTVRNVPAKKAKEINLMKMNKRLFGFLLSLALTLLLLPGLTAYADFYATEITDYCPIMDKNGSITKYKVSVKIYDTRHIQRKVRLMFVPTGHGSFPDRFLTGGEIGRAHV